MKNKHTKITEYEIRELDASGEVIDPMLGMTKREAMTYVDKWESTTDTPCLVLEKHVSRYRFEELVGAEYTSILTRGPDSILSIGGWNE